MKKILMLACVIVMVIAANACASPAFDSYLRAIARMEGPKSVIPTPPKGYGAARDEQTGDLLILVPGEYCGTNPPGYMVILGRTTYGSQIRGYCPGF